MGVTGTEDEMGVTGTEDEMGETVNENAPQGKIQK